MSFRSRVRFLLGHIEFSVVSKVSCGFSSLVLASPSLALRLFFSHHRVLKPWLPNLHVHPAKSPLPSFFQRTSKTCQPCWDLLEEPASIPQNTGAKPKKKSSKKASPPAEDPSASVENQIRLEVLRKENLTMQLKIAETQLQLAQLNVSPSACGAVATTPPSSPQKLQSALAPNASSSSSSLPEFGAISSLD